MVIAVAVKARSHRLSTDSDVLLKQQFKAQYLSGEPLTFALKDLAEQIFVGPSRTQAAEDQIQGFIMAVYDRESDLLFVSIVHFTRGSMIHRGDGMPTLDANPRIFSEKMHNNYMTKYVRPSILEEHEIG